MKKKKVGMTVGTVAVAITLAAYVARKRAEKTTYGAQGISKITPRKMGLYEKYIKRGIDIVCATGALIVFSPVYLIVALLVKCKLGSPVLFTQERPDLQKMAEKQFSKCTNFEP